MRKDNKRKSGKRKSVDVDKRSCSNSVTESAAKVTIEETSDEILNIENEETIPNGEDENSADDKTTGMESNSIPVENSDEETVTEVEKENEKPNELESTKHESIEPEKEPILVNGNSSPKAEELIAEQASRATEPRKINDENEDASNEQKRKTNEAALRLYTSLNQLAMQALMNVKQEPLTSDMQLPEKYMHNIIASLNESYLGLEDASLHTHMLRPPAEMSADAMANQLRYNDCVSMVVRRENNIKNRMGVSDSGGSGGLKGGPNSNSGSVVSGPGSGLHQFVTRYTIERTDDPSRTGIEICLTGDDPLDPIIEVECGGNKGLLYVSKLCQGSKGQSILFNDEWLTPNEFQFISGRETAKDWKRSIRHCGKSLKTLMTKGILQVHPPVCECDYCKGQGPATVEKARKRPFGPTQERQISNCDTMRSGGSTTPSSTESVTPLSAGFTESPSIALHKPLGREGGLNSIISHLHSKKAIGGNDIRSGNGEESLDLRVRGVSSASPAGSANARKRQREPELKLGSGGFGETEEQLPMKRRYSNEEGKFPVLRAEASRLDRGQNNGRRKSPHSSDSLCLSALQTERKQEKDNFYATISPQRDEQNGSHDGERGGENRSKSYQDSTSPPASSGNSLYPDFYKTARGFQNMPYDHAFFDAMKRAVANVTAGAYTDQVRSRSSPPPARSSSSGSSSLQRGFINLESISRRLGGSSPHPQPSKDQPMVELTSHRKINGRYSEHYDYDRRNNESNNMESHKAPLTVLHHRPNHFENLSHRQSSTHYYGMPPPFFHNSRSRVGGDRHRFGNSPGASRADRKLGKHKGLTRKHLSEEGCRRRNVEMPMMDLHNHAIPMLSLTYSNKKKSSNSDEKRNDIRSFGSSRNPDRSQSAFGIQNKTIAHQRKAVSDDESCRKDDLLRRNSASAPPQPPFSDSAINGGTKYLDDNNNEKSKDMKDDVFSRPRAKSASPNVIRTHPYLDGSRSHPRSSSSLEGGRPESNFSSFHESSYEATAPNLMQQYELLRYRDVCSAIENMGSWSTDDVCSFLKNIGCDQYQEVFRDHGIDGDALPLLMEHHLVNKMGLKLGHALKVIARVHRRLGNHCAIIGERFGPSQFSQSYRPFFPLMHSVSGGSDANTLQLNGFTESNSLPEKEID